MGAVNVAPASDDWALASWAWAEATLAESEAIWALDAPLAWSDASRALAESTLAWAPATWLSSAAESTVASTVPLVTCWPAFTLTAVT